MPRIGILLPCFLLAIALPAGATNWIVYPDGSGDVTTISEAVLQAADGDTILLGDGTFSGPGNRGVYLLNRDLVIRSISDDPYACIIDCYEELVYHRAFNVDGGTPEIRGLTIQNGSYPHGGGLYITAGTPTFYNIRLYGNHAVVSGGGAYVAAGATPRFYSSVFYQNTSDEDGAALDLRGGANATVNDCLFQNNIAARNGGAVLAMGSGAEFFGCRFVLNEAGFAGGGLFSVLAPGPYFESCRFFINRAESQGGALFCSSDTDPEFSDVTFVRNYAGQGGVLFAEGFAAPRLDGCTMSDNVTYGGGLIYCRSGAAPVLDRCLIAWGRSSAAFENSSATGISLSCCDLFGNDNGDWVNGIEGQLGIDGNINGDPLLCDPKAEYQYLAANSPCLSENSSCGAIGAHSQGCDSPTYYLDGYPGAFLETIQEAIDLAPIGATILLQRSSYSGPGNRDLNFGGKDLVLKPQSEAGMVVIDCEGTFEDPHRAFVFENHETRDARVERITIRNGHAPDHGDMISRHAGGAITCHFSSPTIVDCRFENCYALQDGGAIHIMGGTSLPVISGCVFDGNQGNTGGGIWSSYGSPEISACQFLNNLSDKGGGVFLTTGEASILQNCLFEGNSTSHSLISRGGGLYIGGASEIHVTVSGCTFRNNDARRGGAVGIYGVPSYPTELTFLDCNFHDNWTIEESEGGAIHAEGEVTLFLDECDIHHNSALSGGGIFMGEIASLDALLLTVTENEAGDLGGGIYQAATSGPISLTECSIGLNEINRLDGGAGAGLWIGGTGGNLVECDIYDNSLYDLGKGGGLFVAPGASLDVTDCSFSGNHADNDGDGGGVYVQQGTCWVDGGRFAENSAGRGGAIMLNQAVSVFLDGSTLHQNTADDGGAMFCLDSSPEANACTFANNGAGQGGHVALIADSNPAFNYCILAFSSHGAAVHIASGGGDPIFTCTDIYRNAGGDWIGGIEPDQYINNNLNLDPLFCDWPQNNFRLAGNSPCLPDNNECGAQIGAWGEGCAATSAPEEVPIFVQLGTNHPNPFNLVTTVRFALPQPSPTRLGVYDASGRQVRVLIEGWLDAGFHEVVFKSQELPSGYYFYRLDADGVRQTRMMTLIK